MPDDPWEIKIHPDAVSTVGDLRNSGCSPLAEQIVKAIENLSEDPYRPRPGMDLRKLRGTDDPVYRLRVRDHRVIYEIVTEEKAVYVTQIVKRDSAYR